MSPAWWPEPAAGDIVWCRFHDGVEQRPKPRPALISVVYEDEAPQFHVRVTYGTSQRTETLFSGEFAILQSRNLAAYQAAGLSFDTKFDFGRLIDLPYNDQWFAVPPAPLHGQTPKLGILHPSLVLAAHAAFRASSAS